MQFRKKLVCFSAKAIREGRRSLLNKKINIEHNNGLDGEHVQEDSEDEHSDRETTRNRPWIDHSTALKLIQSCKGRVKQFQDFVDSRET